MSTDNSNQAKTLVAQYPSISKFLSDWIAQELEKSRQAETHIFLAYLTSPYGQAFAEKISGMFETFLHSAAGECQRLRRKVIQTTTQSELESVLFELEIGSLLVKHGYALTVEPLYPQKGPDFKTVLSGQTVYIEAKKLQHDAEEKRLWNTLGPWTRTHTQSDFDKREWKLYQRYLATNQFPDDGLHILVLDTLKSSHADELMLRAWRYYCCVSSEGGLSHPIHALVICRRADQQHSSWLNKLTDGADILWNTSLPVQHDVLDAVIGIFHQ